MRLTTFAQYAVNAIRNGRTCGMDQRLPKKKRICFDNSSVCSTRSGMEVASNDWFGFVGHRE